MAVTQYIGSRYVPLFADPIEWSSQNTYEPLTIVLHEGNSFTSKQAVPKGIDISNEEFWAITGNYNAQIELYRRDTAQALEEAQQAQTSADAAQTSADAAQTSADAAQASANAAQEDIDTLLPKESFSAENTIKGYIDSSIESIEALLDQMINEDDSLIKVLFSGVEPISKAYATVLKLPKSKWRFATMPINASTQNLDPTYQGQKYQQTYVYARNTTDRLLFNLGLLSPTVINGQSAITSAVVDGVDTGVYWNILAIKGDNVIILPDPSHNITIQNLLANQYDFAFGVFEQIVVNGHSVNLDQYSGMENYEQAVSGFGARMCFGWDSENWYVLYADGRQAYNRGISHDACVSLCTQLGIRNMINGDGGGSIQIYLPNSNFCPTTVGQNTYANIDSISPDMRRNVISLVQMEVI